MTRPFAWLAAVFTATIGFLVGMVVTGSMTPTPAVSAPEGTTVTARVRDADEADRRPALALPPGAVNFADVAERLNPAVVNIDATARGRRLANPSGPGRRPFTDDVPEERRPRDTEPRRGTGTGFVISADGFILTNHHVIDGAERLSVKLMDGRSLRATVVGSDPDTDIALIKVESPAPLRFAILGNSEALRVGEWVCAIGNPLAYEHTVTVGVVSFIGRKLFDSSLDNYIQTDAAISFGNSGGPLINGRGEVVGINSAVSRQSNNIGFAVPINQAKAILPQLKTLGRVSRGYIGVALRDVDPDLQAPLKLSRADGALVQDVTAGSPGERAGIRPYDLIVSVDRQPVQSNDALIRQIAERAPGSSARLEVVRDGRSRDVTVKLAERPVRTGDDAGPRPSNARPARIEPSELGLSLIEIDDANAHRFDVPAGMTGLLVQRVEPLSAAYDAAIVRGQVILEVNRQRVNSVAGFRRVVEASRPGDALAVFVYDRELEQRAIHAVRTEPR